jgi:hypothetical protein
MPGHTPENAAPMPRSQLADTPVKLIAARRTKVTRMPAVPPIRGFHWFTPQLNISHFDQ